MAPGGAGVKGEGSASGGYRECCGGWLREQAEVQSRVRAASHKGVRNGWCTQLGGSSTGGQRLAPQFFKNLQSILW